jgi:hypothetical protein
MTQNTTWIPPGSIVATPVQYGQFEVWHEGVATSRLHAGAQTIISASKNAGRRVVEQPLPAFRSQGVLVVRGYPGRLPPHVVERRARSRIGHAWRLRDANCEHLTRWAHGLTPTSPQVRAGAVALVSLGLVAAMVAALRRR